jgi:hypothetical protein
MNVFDFVRLPASVDAMEDVSWCVRNTKQNYGTILSNQFNGFFPGDKATGA